MQITIREPGSAITHFIAMMMAVFAAVPLLVKAGVQSGQENFLAMAIFMGSMILLYGASATYHSVDLTGKSLRVFRKLDHMMIFVLIAGSYTPVCLIVLGGKLGYTLLALVWGIGRPHRLDHAGTGMGHCRRGHPHQRAVDHLPQVVFFPDLHCHGLGMCPGIRASAENSVHARFSLAVGRRHHLHRGRCHLCPEAADLQCET